MCKASLPYEAPNAGHFEDLRWAHSGCFRPSVPLWKDDDDGLNGLPVRTRRVANRREIPSTPPRPDGPGRPAVDLAGFPTTGMEP